MKYLLTILSIMFFSSNICAQKVPLDSIKKEIILFMQKHERISPNHTTISNSIIREVRLKKSIEEGMNGVFALSLLRVHQNTHFLLVDSSCYEIINMRNPLDESIEKLLNYLKRNDYYTKEDIMFYVSFLIRVYRQNKIEDKRVA